MERRARVDAALEIMSTLTSPEPTLAKPVLDAAALWRQTVEAELKGVPFEKKLVTRTSEGIALQPLYGPSAALPSSARTRKRPSPPTANT